MGTSGSPLSIEEQKHIRNVLAQLQDAKKKRVQQMHLVERQRAFAKGQSYLAEIAAAKCNLQQQQVSEQEQEAAQALQDLSAAFEQRMVGIGQAHLDAAKVAEVARNKRLEQGCREAELARRQAARFRDALTHVKAETDAPKKVLDQHKERRKAILQMERQKATRFSQQKLSTAAALRSAQDEEQLLEQERRRRQQHSLTDFRFSRMHEQQYQKPAMQECAACSPERHMEVDPAQAALEYQRRQRQLAEAKAARQAEASMRAKERYDTAQAKLKADAEMARMEQELRAAEAARLCMRKQTLAQHRLRLQDRNKQQALTRIFEQNFGEALGGGTDAAPVQRPVPAFLRRSASPQAPAGVQPPHPPQPQQQQQASTQALRTVQQDGPQGLPQANPTSSKPAHALAVPAGPAPAWSKGRPMRLGRQAAAVTGGSIGGKQAVDMAVQTYLDVSEHAHSAASQPSSQAVAAGTPDSAAGGDAAAEAGQQRDQDGEAGPARDGDGADGLDAAMDAWLGGVMDEELRGLQQQLGLEHLEPESSAASSIQTITSVPSFVADMHATREMQQAAKAAHSALQQMARGVTAHTPTRAGVAGPGKWPELPFTPPTGLSSGTVSIGTLDSSVARLLNSSSSSVIMATPGTALSVFGTGSSLSTVSPAAQHAAQAACTRLPAAYTNRAASAAVAGGHGATAQPGTTTRDTPSSSLFTASPGLDLDDTLLLQELEGLGLDLSSEGSPAGNITLGATSTPSDGDGDASLSSIQELVSLGVLPPDIAALLGARSKLSAQSSGLSSITAFSSQLSSVQCMQPPGQVTHGSGVGRVDTSGLLGSLAMPASQPLPQARSKGGAGSGLDLYTIPEELLADTGSDSESNSGLGDIDAKDSSRRTGFEAGHTSLAHLVMGPVGKDTSVVNDRYGSLFHSQSSLSSIPLQPSTQLPARQQPHSSAPGMYAGNAAGMPASVPLSVALASLTRELLSHKQGSSPSSAGGRPSRPGPITIASDHPAPAAGLGRTDSSLSLSLTGMVPPPGQAEQHPAALHAGAESVSLSPVSGGTLQQQQQQQQVLIPTWASSGSWLSSSGTPAAMQQQAGKAPSTLSSLSSMPLKSGAPGNAIAGPAGLSLAGLGAGLSGAGVGKSLAGLLSGIPGMEAVYQQELARLGKLIGSSAAQAPASLSAAAADPSPVSTSLSTLLPFSQHGEAQQLPPQSSASPSTLSSLSLSAASIPSSLAHMLDRLGLKSLARPMMLPDAGSAGSAGAAAGTAAAAAASLSSLSLSTMNEAPLSQAVAQVAALPVSAQAHITDARGLQALTAHAGGGVPASPDTGSEDSLLLAPSLGSTADSDSYGGGIYGLGPAQPRMEQKRPGTDAAGTASAPLPLAALSAGPLSQGTELPKASVQAVAGQGLMNFGSPASSADHSLQAGRSLSLSSTHSLGSLQRQVQTGLAQQIEHYPTGSSASSGAVSSAMQPWVNTEQMAPASSNIEVQQHAGSRPRAQGPLNNLLQMADAMLAQAGGDGANLHGASDIAVPEVEPTPTKHRLDNQQPHPSQQQYTPSRSSHSASEQNLPVLVQAASPAKTAAHQYAGAHADSGVWASLTGDRLHAALSEALAPQQGGIGLDLLTPLSLTSSLTSLPDESELDKMLTSMAEAAGAVGTSAGPAQPQQGRQYTELPSMGSGADRPSQSQFMPQSIPLLQLADEVLRHAGLQARSAPSNPASQLTSTNAGGSSRADASAGEGGGRDGLLLATPSSAALSTSLDSDRFSSMVAGILADVNQGLQAMAWAGAGPQAQPQQQQQQPMGNLDIIGSGGSLFPHQAMQGQSQSPLSLAQLSVPSSTSASMLNQRAGNDNADSTNSSPLPDLSTIAPQTLQLLREQQQGGYTLWVQNHGSIDRPELSHLLDQAANNPNGNNDRSDSAQGTTFAEAPGAEASAVPAYSFAMLPRPLAVMSPSGPRLHRAPASVSSLADDERDELLHSQQQGSGRARTLPGMETTMQESGHLSSVHSPGSNGASEASLGSLSDALQWFPAQQGHALAQQSSDGFISHPAGLHGTVAEQPPQKLDRGMGAAYGTPVSGLQATIPPAPGTQHAAMDDPSLEVGMTSGMALADYGGLGAADTAAASIVRDVACGVSPRLAALSVNMRSAVNVQPLEIPDITATHSGRLSGGVSTGLGSLPSAGHAAGGLQAERSTSGGGALDGRGSSGGGGTPVRTSKEQDAVLQKLLSWTMADLFSPSSGSEDAQSPSPSP